MRNKCKNTVASFFLVRQKQEIKSLTKKTTESEFSYSFVFKYHYLFFKVIFHFFPNVHMAAIFEIHVSLN